MVLFPWASGLVGCCAAFISVFGSEYLTVSQYIAIAVFLTVACQLRISYMVCMQCMYCYYE